jgi:hypothetical protein
LALEWIDLGENFQAGLRPKVMGPFLALKPPSKIVAAYSAPET